MTQPGGQQSGSGGAVAAAATALALLYLEQQTRQQADDAIAAAMKTIAAAAIVAAAQPPGVLITGLALLAVPALHATIVASIEKVRQQIADVVKAGYLGGAEIARQELAGVLAETGYTVSDTLPELYPNLDALDADVTVMTGNAQTQLYDDLAAAYDHSSDPAQRTLNMQHAADGSRARLRMRAQAAAGTAVHQGSTDAQQAIFAEYQNHHSTPLMKRWVTTSTEPCGMCAGLDGTTIAVSSTFDPDATTDPRDWRHPWRILQGPPRHPNCRCRLDLVHL